jgi:hypothetical protein
MNRFPLIAIALLALVAVPTFAVADSDDDSDVEHTRRAWYVDVEGDGTCYVRYKPRPVEGIQKKYISADQAYKALVENPACSISAGQLQQLGFGQ